ncbi:DUF4160 domain-containing protein [Sulfuricurvum sp.]|uniref:DUF4160 domain-containing protein n=1 Tax=Sulfuricurvum sp. TaxID=2025608 RepID=UPI003BB6B132
MPEISRFYGIIIRMYLIDSEHPPRHIHVKYGEFEAILELVNLNIIEGSLPKTCRKMVREWTEIHQSELIEMWDTQNFHSISPLE